MVKKIKKRKTKKRKASSFRGINPVILLVLDGYGLRSSKRHNAVLRANRPNLKMLWKTYPHTRLHAAGEWVGLPKRTMGNSETGHRHIGAGRKIEEAVVRIDRAIENGSFFKNKELAAAMETAKKNHSALHLMGLVSDGSVHSHINHLFALLKMAKRCNVKTVYVHCFLDGRDTPPRSAKKHIVRLQKKMRSLRTGEIVSLMGRFYAMDRDNRWNREHKAYDAMVNGKAAFYFDDPLSAIDAAYKRGESDEFIQPTIIRCGPHRATHLVNSRDAVVFFNFRSDRAREITRAFVDGRFNKFKRKKIIDLHFVCLTQYDRDIKVPAAFPPPTVTNTLGEVVSRNGLWQLRLAETEKYAHVTFFFNAGRDGPYQKEDRILIPSPKTRTYDHTPGMSAFQIARATCDAIKKKKYALIVVNFANADMVGHSGNELAAAKGIETVDRCIGMIVQMAQKKGYEVIVTADHGNAENMTEHWVTSHTTNDVPCIVVSQRKIALLQDANASLADVAPTILELMGLHKPKVMTGKTLIQIQE
ncbi:2,3-bisphosphoglycerate-independent phosphoglycerate mutase [Candidatus Woesearchaeota archaeon]|nr:2,3-bisphosphoglycerate-independent phosphoglycerate mutase [Candidatus Woesearchaeota archaeon]